jgi:hypothetical protein
MCSFSAVYSGLLRRHLFLATRQHSCPFVGTSYKRTDRDVEDEGRRKKSVLSS